MTCSQKKIWVSTKKNLRTPTPDITYQHNLVLGLTPYLNFPQKANGIKLTFSTNKGSKMEDKHCDWLFRNVINLFKKLIPIRIFFLFSKNFWDFILARIKFLFQWRHLVQIIWKNNKKLVDHQICRQNNAFNNSIKFIHYHHTSLWKCIPKKRSNVQMKLSC